MNRCEMGSHRADRCLGIALISRRSALTNLTLLAATLWWSAAVAHAQTLTPGHRSFPPDTLRGQLRLGTFPQAWLNGQPITLAPGIRVRQGDNLLVPPQQVAGQDLTVHYRTEAATGQVRDIWLLNAAERANSTWPSTPQQAQTWAFDPNTQRWSAR